MKPWRAKELREKQIGKILGGLTVLWLQYPTKSFHEILYMALPEFDIAPYTDEQTEERLAKAIQSSLHN